MLCCTVYSALKGFNPFIKEVRGRYLNVGEMRAAGVKCVMGESADSPCGCAHGGRQTHTMWQKEYSNRFFLTSSHWSSEGNSTSLVNRMCIYYMQSLIFHPEGKFA